MFMKDYYKEFDRRQKFLQEYFDDEEYEKRIVAYKHLYMPFIKEFLPLFIKSYFPTKVTNLNSLNDVIIRVPLVHISDSDEDLIELEYRIMSNTFYVSAKYIDELDYYINKFIECYNLNRSRYSLKELIDAYYMELQRLEYETLEEEKTHSYYDEYNEERQINENLIYTYVEELFEDEFLNRIIPQLIENNYQFITADANLETYNLKGVYIGTCDSICYNVSLIISEEYIEYFMKLVRNFIQDYNLGVVRLIGDNMYKIEFKNMKALLDAYYMENQRLEYIKGESLKRK